MSNEKNDFEADATLARLKNASPSDANQVDSDRVLVKATRAQNQPSVKYSNFMSKLAQLSRKAKLSLAGFGVSATAAGAALVLTFGAGAASQPLIMLAAGSPNVGAESNRSGLAVGQEASTDKMMLPFFNFEYVAGSEIPDATGKGKIYQLVLDGDPEATMARLATRECSAKVPCSSSRCRHSMLSLSSSAIRSFCLAVSPRVMLVTRITAKAVISTARVSTTCNLWRQRSLMISLDR